MADDFPWDFITTPMGRSMSGPYPNSASATVYYGSAACSACGGLVDPVQAMYTRPWPSCTPCSQQKAAKHVKNRMTSDR